MKIHVQIPLIPYVIFFRVFSYYFIRYTLTHMTASNTVIDDVTTWVTYRMHHTARLYSGVYFTLKSDKNLAI